MSGEVPQFTVALDKRFCANLEQYTYYGKAKAYTFMREVMS